MGGISANEVGIEVGSVNVFETTIVGDKRGMKRGKTRLGNNCSDVGDGKVRRLTFGLCHFIIPMTFTVRSVGNEGSDNF